MDPAELGRPAVVSAPPLDDHNYILWNRALASHCLLGDEFDEVLYLTITPTILAAALSEVQPGRLLPEDAEAAFIAAVLYLVASAIVADPLWTGVTFGIVLAGIPVYLVAFRRRRAAG